MAKSGFTIESLTNERQVFRATVQPEGGRVSVPRILAELNGWKFDAPIWLRVERRDKKWEGKYDLSSGHEIDPRKNTDLRDVLKKGARVRVTVAETFAGLNSVSWMPAYLSSLSAPRSKDAGSN